MTLTNSEKKSATKFGKKKSHDPHLQAEAEEEGRVGRGLSVKSLEIHEKLSRQRVRLDWSNNWNSVYWRTGCYSRHFDEQKGAPHSGDNRMTNPKPGGKKECECGHPEFYHCGNECRRSYGHCTACACGVFRMKKPKKKPVHPKHVCNMDAGYDTGEIMANPKLAYVFWCTVCKKVHRHRYDRCACLLLAWPKGPATCDCNHESPPMIYCACGAKKPGRKNV